jgi:hypothetical protein
MSNAGGRAARRALSLRAATSRHSMRWSERDHAKAQTALVRRDAVRGRLAREGAFSVLKVAAMRPTRDVVLTLKGNRPRHCHLPARGGRGCRSGRRSRSRCRGGRALRRGGIRTVRSRCRGGRRIRLLLVSRLRLRIGLRGIALGRIPLGRIGSRRRSRRRGIILLFHAGGENSEKGRQGSAE